MTKRFTNKGRLTNYEMADLRDLPKPRKVWWRHAWSSLADPFHPRSQEEWTAYVEEQES